MARRLAVPGIRAMAALREVHAANFPHRGILYHRTRIVDPVTRRETINYTEGATIACRINPASEGGVNVVAGQDTVAGDWIVSFAWNQAGLREHDRVLVKQGPESQTTFAQLVEFERILRPRTAEVVTTCLCSSVELTA